jgi:hypothetical protein
MQPNIWVPSTSKVVPNIGCQIFELTLRPMQAKILQHEVTLRNQQDLSPILTYG